MNKLQKYVIDTYDLKDNDMSTKIKKLLDKMLVNKLTDEEFDELALEFSRIEQVLGIDNDDFEDDFEDEHYESGVPIAWVIKRKDKYVN